MGIQPGASAGTDSVLTSLFGPLGAPQPFRCPEGARGMKKQRPTETQASSQAAAKPQVFERLGPRERGTHRGKCFSNLRAQTILVRRRTLFSVSCQYWPVSRSTESEGPRSPGAHWEKGTLSDPGFLDKVVQRPRPSRHWRRSCLIKIP